MARGRDAADVAFSTTFGPNTLKGFTVVTDEIVSEPVRPEVPAPPGRVVSSGPILTFAFRFAGSFCEC